MAWFAARLKRAPKHTRFSEATAKAVKASLVWHLSHPLGPRHRAAPTSSTHPFLSHTAVCLQINVRTVFKKKNCTTIASTSFLLFYIYKKSAVSI